MIVRYLDIIINRMFEVTFVKFKEIMNTVTSCLAKNHNVGIVSDVVRSLQFGRCEIFATRKM